jgi:glycosyltransferase involved in cell wall biosynthesis
MTNVAEQRVLFVSQVANRTGAPVLLLQFLQWLRTNTSIDFDVVLREGGELSAEFAALAPIWHVEATPGRLAHTTMRVARRLGLGTSPDDAHIDRMVRQLSHRRFGVVYSNTVWNGAFIARLRALGCPVVTHVHELESNILRPGEENLRLVKAQTSRYIACSEAVKSNLIVRHGIECDRIDVIHGFVAARRALTDAQRAEARARTRLELGIPEGAYVVGGAGTTNWAKSPDLFVQLAYAMHRRRPARPVHFVWVGGGSPQGHRLTELRLDAERAGVGDIMHFPGTRSNATEYFCAFDVYALVSREDSYPLVCLEVASLGMPILCFDRAGGAREFVEDDCGFVVPYLEVEVMADRTLELLASDELRHRMGERAKAKVRERHDVTVAAPRVLDVIRRVASESAKSASDLW